MECIRGPAGRGNQASAGRTWVSQVIATGASMRFCNERLILTVLVLGCAISAVGRCDVLYSEQYRPQFHFSPPNHWMNDPNGLVYAGGVYHLFYQYNPYGSVWGPMHWGHAISRDRIHWKNLPIALFPDRHGTIFSGSAVVDSKNTSGFGTAKNPPLVAIFTYNQQFGEHQTVGQQDEGIAYSLDQGSTWVKFAGNPVLRDPGHPDFRDPKVFWYAPRHIWIMTLAVHDHVGIYSSPDLKHWVHESDFGVGFGAHGGVWECPDLIELPVVGESVKKAALLVSVNPGGPNGGSATQYFIGKFDGHRFTPDASPVGMPITEPHWIDYGADDYAGSTWSGAKHGDSRVVFIGWMSNWEYSNAVPTQGWRGAMTVPRELNLVKASGAFELRSRPVSELDALRAVHSSIGPRTVSGPVDLTAGLEGNNGLLELDLSLKTGNSETVELTFSNAQHQQTTFTIDKSRRRYVINRSASGVTNFAKTFPALQIAPMTGTGEQVTLRAFLDRSSLELFINDGETVLTTTFFPSTPYNKIILSADAPASIRSGDVYQLKSIWHAN